MSFLLDPPLLVASGALAERALGDGDERALRVVGAASVGAFVAVSAALYANAEPISSRWPKLGARSGREFMITSGLAEIDESAIGPGRHAAALSLFLLYPLWFRLGRALARG